MAVEAYPRAERTMARAHGAPAGITGCGVIFVQNGEAPRGVGAISKRAVDVAAGGTGLVLLAPLLLLIAGCVRLDLPSMRGWSFFKDLRILLQTIPVVVTGKGAC